jgi:hypothetical protein
VTRIHTISLSLAAAALLGACAEVPTQPSVAVMPAPNKPIEVFQAEDQQCRGYAQQQVGGQTTGGEVNNGTATGAVVGAATGAAAGALIGRSGGAAGVGAGAGLLLGAAAGNNYGASSAYGLQRRYDIAYQQCMYAKGNQLPQYRPRYYYAPPPPGYYPPPPPNYPPPANYPPPPPPAPGY